MKIVIFIALTFGSLAGFTQEVSDFERGYNAGVNSQLGRVIQVKSAKRREVVNFMTYIYTARDDIKNLCADGEVKQIVCTDEFYEDGNSDTPVMVCSGICINK